LKLSPVLAEDINREVIKTNFNVSIFLGERFCKGRGPIFIYYPRVKENSDGKVTIGDRFSIPDNTRFAVIQISSIDPITPWMGFGIWTAGKLSHEFVKLVGEIPKK
tara:strand:+ start:2653 stop:2970 length:318 start_codon:yes stop_codon:yes gene_type:complete